MITRKRRLRNGTIAPIPRMWSQSIADGVNVYDIIIAGVSLFDLLWVFLGVGTAFGIVMKKSLADVMAMQQERRAAEQVAD